MLLLFGKNILDIEKTFLDDFLSTMSFKNVLKLVYTSICFVWASKSFCFLKRPPLSAMNNTHTGAHA